MAGRASRVIRQQFLSEEMKPQIIQEIEDAAQELYAIRTERIELNKQEDEAQTNLVVAMEKHKLNVYKTGKLIVTIEPGKTKAKVKEAAAPEGEVEHDDGQEED